MKQANTKILSFDERLPLVRVEVSKRVSALPKAQKETLQARLWCQWLRREVSL